jgi:hypothetical protein
VARNYSPKPPKGSDDDRSFNDRVLDVVRFWQGTSDHLDTAVPRSIRQNVILPDPAVTNLPDEPYDGQEVDYHPGGALSGSPVWRFVWRSALNSGSGAWAFVGGPPMYHAISTSQRQTATSTWGDLATIGPTVTVPVGGDYLVRITAGCVNKFSGANRVIIGASIGATNPVAWEVGADIAAVNHYENVSTERVMTGLSASNEIRLRYYQVNDGVDWTARMLTVTPIELRPGG